MLQASFYLTVYSQLKKTSTFNKGSEASGLEERHSPGHFIQHDKKAAIIVVTSACVLEFLRFA